MNLRPSSAAVSVWRNRLSGRAPVRLRGAVATGLAGLIAVLPSAAAAQIEPTEITGKRLNVTASLQGGYDSNIFRTDPDILEPTDDFLVTPRLIAEYRQPVGRHDFTIAADAAYSYYTRNNDRSRIRLQVDGDANIRVAGTCLVQPSVRLLRQRADYGDINGAVDNFQTFQTYSVAASCPRSAGFYPLVEYSHDRTKNDPEFAFADQVSDRFRGGIGYSRPSLGQFSAYYSYLSSDREALGIVNKVDQAGVTFRRAVVSRFVLEGDVHYLDVRSKGANVPSYSGVGWVGSLVYRPVPALLFRGETARRIVNDSLVPAGFAVLSEYALRAQAEINDLTTFTLGFERGERNFRRDPQLVFSSIGADNYTNFIAGATRQIGRRLQLTADVRHIRRRTDSDANEFDATIGTVGVTFKF